MSDERRKMEDAFGVVEAEVVELDEEVEKLQRLRDDDRLSGAERERVERNLEGMQENAKRARWHLEAARRAQLEGQTREDIDSL